MSRRSIRHRLIVLLLIPIAALVFFGAGIVVDRRDEATEMERVRRLMEVAVRAGELLHHTQRERGLSAGFLGSRGDASFKTRLTVERGRTDAAAGALRASFDALSKSDVRDALARNYTEVTRFLAELGGRRSAVDTLGVEGAEVVTFYSVMNERILAMVTTISREPTVVEIANRGAAYVSFMRAKEAAGIERAVLTNTYGAGTFAPGMYARLLSLVALQDEYLATFHVYGGEAAQQQYRAAMSGEFAEATRKMRETAIAGGGVTVEPVDAKLWFARQTEKIDAMATVESWLAKDILATAAFVAGQAERSFVGTAAGITAVVLITCLLAALVLRSIVRPLGRAVEVLSVVGRGDFTRRLDVAGQDEVGRMAVSLNEAVEAIHDALGDVRSVSNSVADSARQISGAAEHMASGAQQQASSLEETAATLEEITATVRQNSANAAEASELAVSSRGVAERGGQIVGEAVAAMSEINRSSQQIAEIITTIDDIAFQTNLLALNASVEAARAGDRGRGFAVVATEVRSLAQRSSGAAREIKGLIHDSVRKVEPGMQLISRSSETLDEIVASAQRVTDVVAHIAAASREQALALEQIGSAVAEMDETTQSNAAKTDELSGTAEAMAEQAEQLRALVARFRLNAGDPPIGVDGAAWPVSAPA